jgi:hypothetical protein
VATAGRHAGFVAAVDATLIADSFCDGGDAHKSKAEDMSSASSIYRRLPR